MYTVLRGVSGGQGASLTNIQRWLEQCKNIDGRFISREFFVDSYERLCPDQEDMSLVQFIQLLGILSRESKQDVQSFLERFQTVKKFIIEEIRQSVMEDAFAKLQKNQQNSVDNLIQWMKHSKIVDGEKVTEEKARQLFAEVENASNVELAEFQEAIRKLANEQEKTVEDFSKTLASEGSTFFNAIMSAANAAASCAVSTFKEAMGKK